jgi:DNA-binding transcriptional MerR regulator
MAKLANTTRRTLIFYDQKGIFKPIKITNSGYRYYNYEQLYDLSFILGLRNLGLSIPKIKAVLQTQDKKIFYSQLLNLEEQIQRKINDLIQIQGIINQKISKAEEKEDAPLYQPFVEKLHKMTFWCSQQSASCTQEEVAQMFSSFYKNFDSLLIMNASQSGFLTSLPNCDPNLYPTASFRIIKEVSNYQSRVIIPKIEKPTGKYAVIRVENTIEGIQRGLKILREFIKEQQLQITKELWQINTDERFIEMGASKYGKLEYLIEDKNLV